jgi:hypothetical protein
MANEENLIPVTELTESEARELSRRGGIASGVARRKKKTMRDTINLALGLRSELTDAEIERYMRVGFADEDIDNQAKIIMGIMKLAAEGDIRAAEFIRDTAGQKPKDSVELSHELTGETRLRLWFPSDDGD